MSLPRVAVTSESKRGGAEKQWSFQQKVACFGRAAEEFSACFLSALRWCVKFLLHDAFNATFFGVVILIIPIFYIFATINIITAHLVTQICLSSSKFCTV